jgi:hypothetical protein
VFELHIQGQTFREIQKALNIGHRKTITEDILAERDLRAEERAAVREADQAEQLARIDDLIKEARARYDKQGTGSLGAAAKALEMRSKLLGLDAAMKLDVGLDAVVEALIAKDGTKDS